MTTTAAPERDRSAVGVQVVVDHVARFGEDYARGFLAAIPEPGGLAGIALGGWVLGRRRRQSRA